MSPRVALVPVALTDKPCDIYPLAGSERGATAGGLWRIAALQRLAALRFYCFAACFVGPSHCLPRGSGQNIVTTRTSTLKGVGTKPADVRFGPKADMCSAIGHVRFLPKATAKADSRKGHVRFTPESGDPCGAKCPELAKS